jgi:hypothetical protein
MDRNGEMQIEIEVQLSEDAVKSEIHELLDRPVLEMISALRI